MPTLLDLMGVSYERRGDKYFFACPIHGGDNPTGATIFAHNKPNWKCWTHGCHLHHGSSLYSFLGAFIGRGSMASKKEIFDFIDGKLKLETRTVNITKQKECAICDILSPQLAEEHRPRYKLELKIPSEYYLERGYTPETLSFFGVGDCWDTNEKNPMANRSIVPIYNKDGALRAYAGRTLIGDKKKWKKSYGFAKANHIYGYNHSKGPILDSGYAVIVEGFGDVWRLNEAGIKTYGAIMGAFMSDYQLYLLECSGAFHLVILTDMDDAGRACAKQIQEIGGKRFTYSVPEYTSKDIGDIKDLDYIRNLVEKNI